MIRLANWGSGSTRTFLKDYFKTMYNNTQTLGGDTQVHWRLGGANEAKFSYNGPNLFIHVEKKTTTTREPGFICPPSFIHHVSSNEIKVVN